MSIISIRWPCLIRWWCIVVCIWQLCRDHNSSGLTSTITITSSTVKLLLLPTSMFMTVPYGWGACKWKNHWCVPAQIVYWTGYRFCHLTGIKFPTTYSHFFWCCYLKIYILYECINYEMITMLSGEMLEYLH